MPYVADSVDREIVESWTKAGVPDELIAKKLGISVPVLHNAFPLELELGDAADLVDVAKTALDMAKSGEHPNMTKFYLEARGGHHWQTNKPQTADTGDVVKIGVDEAEFEDISNQQRVSQEPKELLEDFGTDQQAVQETQAAQAAQA